jgi:flagellar protein FlgJ
MSALALSPSAFAATLATQAPAPASAAEMAKRGHTHETAVKFEASFLTRVLQTMFKSVTTSAPFGGGEGEDMWKSFLAEQMAKQMSKRGGIGISKSVEREMLKLQGLSETHA